MGIFPRPKVVLAVVALLVFGAILVIDGFVRSGIGGDEPRPVVQGSVAKVPFTVTHGASIVDSRARPVKTFALKPNTIALTIDAGPDPRWTPAVLAVLEHFDVPATFFVSGSQVVQNADLLKDVRKGGSEIGVRAFSGIDLAYASSERMQREVSLTQLSIAGAVGETTYLARPPYSASASGLNDDHYGLVEKLAGQGFVSVFSDVVGKDWPRRSTDDILKDIVKPDRKGVIIGLDGTAGGPAQLASALSRVIPALKAKGYTFSTVTAGAQLPAANGPARDRDVNIGKGMIIAVSVSMAFVFGLEILLLVTGALVVLRLLLMLVFALYHAIRRRPKRWKWGPPVTDPVSVIVPAYNEKECIASTVRSLMASDHPIEIIVVDDGSSDNTAEIVRAMRLPGVRVIRQANAGKPAALNNGIRHARHELIVMMDGDTVFEPDTIRLLVQPFARPEVGAVSGNAKVANRKKVVGAWQHIEYVIGFNIDRRIADLLGCMTTIPGAVGAFRRKALKQVAGVSDDTLAEDTDLTMAISAKGWRVVYEERARAWTEAPTTLQQLWRQRYRWSYGTMQAMWKHRRTIYASGPAGRMGRIGLLNLAIFQVLLPSLAPLIDVFLIYGLLALDPVATVLLWAAVLGIQMASGLLAFAMERQNPLPLLWMPLQQVVYRQLMYSVLLKSIGTAFAGARLKWQKLKRVGDFGTMGAPAPGQSGAGR